jgi:hypothetical protein
VLLGAAALLHHVGRTWGATPAERRMPLPGDGIVLRPFGSTTHAVDVDAPPERVWPWIVQMGYHRAGWYTPDWVDHWIWRIDNPSADRVVPELQHLAVGDIVPDGEPGTAFYTVAQLEPARVLVLRSDSHVPVPLRPVMRVLWTWAFVLQPREEGRRTRLLLRARATGSLTAGLMWHLMVVPSDFVMARSMLHGIRDRAQRTG